MCDRLAYLEIVEWRLLVVDRKDGLAFGRADHDLEARVGLDLRQRVAELEIGQRLYVAREQRRHGRGRVRDDAELGLVERHGITPVPVGLDDRDRRALGPVVELEGAGANRLFLVRLRRFGRDDHRIAPAHIVEEGALRILQRHFHGGGVDCFYCVDRGKQAFLRVGRIVGAGPVEREFHVVGVEVGAVMEFDAGPELERIDLAVVGNGPAFGQRRQHLAARADARQALEHVGVEHFVDRGRGAGRRIEMRRLERHAEHEVGSRGHCRGARGERHDGCCED